MPPESSAPTHKSTASEMRPTVPSASSAAAAGANGPNAPKAPTPHAEDKGSEPKGVAPVGPAPSPTRAASGTSGQSTSVPTKTPDDSGKAKDEVSGSGNDVQGPQSTGPSTSKQATVQTAASVPKVPNEDDATKHSRETGDPNTAPTPTQAELDAQAAEAAAKEAKAEPYSFDILGRSPVDVLSATDVVFVRPHRGSEIVAMSKEAFKDRVVKVKEEGAVRDRHSGEIAQTLVTDNDETIVLLARSFERHEKGKIPDRYVKQ